MNTPQFPLECKDFNTLRAWAQDWYHLNDVPTQVHRLFEEWDYRVKEVEHLEARITELKAQLAAKVPI